jgi:hypothetical protein
MSLPSNLTFAEDGTVTLALAANNGGRRRGQSTTRAVRERQRRSGIKRTGFRRQSGRTPTGRAIKQTQVDEQLSSVVIPTIEEEQPQDGGLGSRNASPGMRPSIA